MTRARSRFTTVVTEEKVDVVAEGHVDLTIDAVSISCDRSMQVDFTTPYYETNQRILVPAGSHLDDLDGAKCA